MRQTVVDFWRVFGYETWNDLPWGAGSKIWWTLHNIAGNLMDIKWLLGTAKMRLSCMENRSQGGPACHHCLANTCPYYIEEEGQ